MRQVTTSFTLLTKQLEALRRHNQSYEHIIGKNSETIKFGKDRKNVMTYVSNMLAPEDLRFIKKVKKHTNECGIEEPERRKISYFSKANIPNRTTYNNCLELDVNKAYWNIALHKGYISEQIFDEGLEIDKQIRLIALGSIASVKEVWEFIPKLGLVQKGEIVNELTRSYFFDVCSYLDNIMDEATKGFGNSILFYWVDAFFSRNDTPFREIDNKKIISLLNSYDLGIKESKIEYVSRKDNLITVQVLGGKKKTFPIPKTIEKPKRPKKLKYSFT